MNFVNKVICKIKKEKSPTQQIDALNDRIARLKRQRTLFYQKKAVLQSKIAARHESVQQSLNGGDLKGALHEMKQSNASKIEAVLNEDEIFAVSVRINELKSTVMNIRAMPALKAAICVIRNRPENTHRAGGARLDVRNNMHQAVGDIMGTLLVDEYDHVFPDL